MSDFKFGPIQTKWLEELESDRHTQTRHTLSCSSGMCCLGVAAKHVLKIEPVRITRSDDEWDWLDGAGEDYDWIETFQRMEGVINYRMACQLGLKTPHGGFHDGDNRPVLIRDRYSLVDLNDAGFTFTEIAQVIRENPELIFEEPR